MTLPDPGRQSADQAGESCLDFLAAFIAFFHSRTSSSVSGELTSATDRGCSSENGAATGLQESQL